MRAELKHSPGRSHPSKHAASSNGSVDAGLEEFIGEIQDLMWKDVGIVRSRTGLKGAIQHLEQLSVRLAHPRTRRSYEARNIHTASLLVARSALAREESRGAHYRTDYPTHNDTKFLKHSLVRGDSIRFV
ncbi:MAG: hypothetical protein DMG75_06400 [Acidobacteria bacterium]|nr:MAG: hypothetical protein DMG75_06400 [Acidobacteriota bacterium]